MCGYLPSGHIFPSSSYLIRGTVGARTWEEFMVHVCAHPGCLGWVYDYLHPSQYEQHKDQKCGVPGCNQRRFIVVKKGSTQQVVPQWWYIDFGLEMVSLTLLCRW